MAFTKEYARICAEMLTDEARRIMKLMADRSGRLGDIKPESIDELVGLELLRRDRNILDNDAPILVLTSRGKKVCAALAEPTQ